MFSKIALLLLSALAPVALAQQSSYESMTQGGFLSFGDNTACRLAKGNSGLQNKDFVLFPLSSFSACQQKCVESRGCQAIEYTSGRCEIWFAKVQTSERVQHFECLIYLPSPNVFLVSEPLLGANEIGASQRPIKADFDGLGFQVVSIDLKANTICFGLTTSDISPITLWHLHRGVKGVNGGAPVVNFGLGSVGNTQAGGANTGSSGCIKADASLLAEIVLFPEGFYVNIHSSEFPDGALRGQLSSHLL